MPPKHKSPNKSNQAKESSYKPKAGYNEFVDEDDIESDYVPVNKVYIQKKAKQNIIDSEFDFIKKPVKKAENDDSPFEIYDKKPDDWDLIE
jgi:hypothetical protein